MITICIDTPITPRIQYTFDLVLGSWLGIEWQIVEANAMLSYAKEKHDAKLHIVPSGILASSDVKPIDIASSQWNTLPAIMPTDGDIPFDIFGAIFFLVSRYEEYLPHTEDRHHRYSPDQSTAARFGFLDRPIIDEWMQRFKLLLTQTFHDISIKTYRSKTIATVDVDNVYSIRHKGFIRNAIHIIRSLIHRDTRSALHRLRVMLHIDDDPYFDLDTVYALHTNPRIESHIFFHCGGFGKFDKRTITPSIRYWRAKRKAEPTMHVGLHPSYRSATRPWLLRLEKRVLELCLGHAVDSTRFHYLLFALPTGYEMLIDAGFTHDYSMAYSDRVGYRASTGRSFPFFNVEQDAVRPLTIHPLIAMDKTLNQNMHLSSDDALLLLLQMRSRAVAAGTDFTTLFHNQNITNEPSWQGWCEMYARYLDHC